MLLPIIILCFCDVILGHRTGCKPYYEMKKARDHFEEFIVSYNKNYATEDEKELRFEIFKNTLIEINRLNLEEELAVYDVNQFSDLTKEEFVNKYTGLKPSNTMQLRSDSNCVSFSDEDINTKTAPNEAFDWREHNAVTGNKNQDQCGSCWAISTTGMIESQLAIKHKKLVPLSVQQLLDCVDGSNCYGGRPIDAVSQLVKQGGQMLEADYPYEMEKNTCKFDKQKVVVNVTECNEFNLKDESKLKELLFTKGPVVIALSMTKLQTYKGGIVMHNECTNDLGHAVLLVGYGKENAVPYWIIKNSFDEDWGENGYFRLEYGKNTCGILDSSIVTAVIA